VGVAGLHLPPCLATHSAPSPCALPYTQVFASWTEPPSSSSAAARTPRQSTSGAQAVQFILPLLPLRCRTHAGVASWYRAPKLLFGSRAYTSVVDIWAQAVRFILPLSPCAAVHTQVFVSWTEPPSSSGSRAYTSAVDIWGAGCVFAELLLRRPFLQVSKLAGAGPI